MTIHMQNWETAVHQLHLEGWQIVWFAFADRDSASTWRVSAQRAGSPSFTLQCDSLENAVLALRDLCQQAPAPCEFENRLEHEAV